MMTDLRKGIFSEFPRGQTIDRYRRNLQRAYVERLEFIMNNDQGSRGRFVLVLMLLKVISALLYVQN
jgi:hypothetical protein